jgi:predicted O-methyltransferase YrrM
MKCREQIERLTFMFKINVLRHRFEYLIPVLQANTSDGKAHYKIFFAQRFCKGKNVPRQSLNPTKSAVRHCVMKNGNMRILDVAKKIVLHRSQSNAAHSLWTLLITKISVRFAAVKLKHEMSRCKSIEDCVNLAFDPFSAFPFSITPQQVREEIIELLEILVRRRPKFVLEVGTHRGGTLFLFARVSSPDAMVVSVDLPGVYDWRIPLYKSFATQNQRVNVVRGDSHDFSTPKMVEQVLAGRKLDFLFVDGDHSYKGVKADFEMYAPLVKKGGIVAFHDIVKPDNGCQADKFWNEIKKVYSCVQVVRDTWAGIGIVYL